MATDNLHFNDVSLVPRAWIAGVLSDIPTLALSGVQFPATQVPSAGANTLDDYEEGTWTPADGSGAALVFTVFGANYVKIGSFVQVACLLQYPATASGANALISGLPFTALSAGGNMFSGTSISNSTLAFDARVLNATSTVNFVTRGGVVITNIQLTGSVLSINALYRV